MRAFILCVFAFAALMGLPQLADHFRRPVAVIPKQTALETDKIAPRGKFSAAPHAAVKKPVESQPALAISAVNGAPAGLLTQSEQPGPAQELLTGLRAAKPEANRNSPPQSSGITLQTAQDQLNGRLSPDPAASPQQSATSEGYLPPWEAKRVRDTQLAQDPAAPENGVAVPARAAVQTGHATNRKRRYAGARHSRPFAGFFWPGF